MPDIVQHGFGAPGSGGPATALARLLDHSKQSYGLIEQREPAGGLSPRLLGAFVTQLRACRPRLVHVRGLGNEGFHAALAARIAGVPDILVSIHGTHRDLLTPGGLRRRIVTGLLEPMTLRLATALVTMCDFAARRDFLDPYRAKLLPPVPNGVPIPALPDPRGPMIRAALGIASDRLVVSTVSRQTPEKGYADLAAALRALDGQARTFDLIIVGGGDHDGRIRALYQGLEHIRVHFAGHQDDVGPWLAASDLFVFASWRENLPNAVLEAMAYGLPVVATSVGGIPEIIAHGGGDLVPPHDPAGLAAALDTMLADGARRARLGRMARETIAGHYSIDHMVTAWEDTYRRILARRG